VIWLSLIFGWIRKIPMWVYVVIALVATGYLLNASLERNARIKQELLQTQIQNDQLNVALAHYEKRVLEVEKLAKERLKTNTVIKTVNKDVIREVKVLVPAGTPELPGGWRLLHDAAAAGEKVDTSTTAGTDAGPVPAEVAAETVIENYGQYNELANDMRLLQRYVKEECISGDAK
jgi:hypothetical protein